MESKDKILDKIKKLLKLQSSAESLGNEEGAEQFINEWRYGDDSDEMPQEVWNLLQKEGQKQQKEQEKEFLSQSSNGNQDKDAYTIEITARRTEGKFDDEFSDKELKFIKKSMIDKIGSESNKEADDMAFDIINVCQELLGEPQFESVDEILSSL